MTEVVLGLPRRDYLYYAGILEQYDPVTCPCSVSSYYWDKDRWHEGGECWKWKDRCAQSSSSSNTTSTEIHIVPTPAPTAAPANGGVTYSPDGCYATQNGQTVLLNIPRCLAPVATAMAANPAPVVVTGPTGGGGSETILGIGALYVAVLIGIPAIGIYFMKR